MAERRPSSSVADGLRGAARGLRHALAVVIIVIAGWVAGGTSVRADAATDDIAACLNIGTAAMTSAGEIAKAVSDPVYAACISQAAAGDVVTIGMMAAVTALWATDTDAFSNPAQCNEYVKNTALKMVAGLLQDIISSNDTVRGLLKGLIGNDGLALIDSIASAAANDLAQSLLDSLWAALGPLTHQLECGCAAAGTVAIIKNAGEDVAKAADSCLDILKDPVAAFKTLLDDPAGVATAVVTAACDAVKETLDVCGYAKDFVTVVSAVCDVPGVDLACDVGEGIVNGAWNGIKSAAHAAKCFFFGCDEPSPPPAPTVCGAGDWPNYGCVCKPPMGVTYQQVKQWSSLYNESYLTTTAVCDYCPSNMGLTIPGDTSCRACPIGTSSRNPDGTPTADGKCSVTYFCADNERYKPNNTGCFSCPAGSQFKPDNSGCMPVCKDYLVNAGGSGSCVCPARADGQTPYDSGSACLVSIAHTCKAGEYHDPATNTCVNHCTGDKQIWVQAGSGDVTYYECKACPEGQVAENNTCVPAPNNYVQTTVLCEADQISTGESCFKCPDGTVKDGNACVPGCAPGSVAKANPPSLKGQLEAAGAVGGDLSLAKQQLGGLKAPGAGAAVSACTLCGENQQTITATSYGNGYSITESYCTNCPTGMVSKPGDATCHWPLEFGVNSLPPKVPGKLNPEQAIPWMKPANWRDFIDKPEPSRSAGEVRAPPAGALTGTPGLPQAEPVCPPGYVMEAGICRIPQTRAPSLTGTPGLVAGVGVAAGAAILIPRVPRGPSSVLPPARRAPVNGPGRVEPTARRKPALSGQEALPQQPRAARQPAARSSSSQARTPSTAPTLTGTEALPQGQGNAPTPAGRAPGLTGTPALPQGQTRPMRAPSLGGSAPEGARPGSRAPSLNGAPALPQASAPRAPALSAPSLSTPSRAPALQGPSAPRAPVLPGAAGPQRAPAPGRQGTDPNSKPF